MLKFNYMEREEVKVNGAKILLSLFEKYKNEPWVLSGSEISKKKRSLWGKGKWGRKIGSQGWAYASQEDRSRWHKYGLKSGISLSGHGNYFEQIYFVSDPHRGLWQVKTVDKYFSLSSLSIKKLKDIFWFDKPNLISFRYGKTSSYSIKLSTPESEFLQEFLEEFNNKVDREIETTEKRKRDDEKKEKERIKSLKKSQNSLLEEFDKDDNGVIDVIEVDDDFMKLFKKHQKKIIELDKDYIQKFVKISNYLKTKRKNIQDVFSSIKNTENKLQLENNVGVLKNQIHTYELLLFHSLNMITSIVEDDLIVFYEIYESLDKLNVFNSNWENEVSQKLSNIGEGLSDLMNSINSMERNIVNGLNELSYVTQEGFTVLGNSVTKELQSIDSSIKFNNLLTGIQAYQMYKIN